MKGHLEVKLPLTTSFQQFYCVLASDASDAEPCFNCYADEDTSTAPRGWILLDAESKAEATPSSTGRLLLTVHAAGKTVVLAADSEANRAAWLRAVETAALRAASRRTSVSVGSRSELASVAELDALIRQGRKAVCVGKNYADHVAELAHTQPAAFDPSAEPPVLFLKPTTSYAFPGTPLVVPAGVRQLHHEVELAAIIGTRCRRLASDDEALAAVAGFCVALDMTDREAQTAAKAKGLPWCVAKGHDTFCPLSAPFAAAAGGWADVELWLDVNGERRQATRASAMTRGLPALLRYASAVFTLEPGDLLLTGTPAGVGPVVAGDRITAGATGFVEMAVDVVAEGGGA